MAELSSEFDEQGIRRKKKQLVYFRDLEIIKEIVSKFDTGSICHDTIFKDLAISKTFLSTGGSDNIIFVVTKKTGFFKKKFVIKLFFHSYLEIPNKDVGFSGKVSNESDAEIAILELLNREIINTNISPFIIRIFGKPGHCGSIENLLPKDCDKYETKTIKSVDDLHYQLCTIKRLEDLRVISPDYKFIFTEVGHKTLHQFLIDIKGSNYNRTDIHQIVMSLIFQIIYTLAAIQSKFPTFRHNDLTTNNVLVISSGFVSNLDEYFKFEYKNKNFYVPNMGYIVKIIDFGRATIKGVIENDIIKNNRLRATINFNDAKNQKIDLIMLIDDLIDSGELPETIDYFLKRIIPPEVIKNEVIKMFFVSENHDLLKKVKTPDQILKSSIFKFYSKVPNSRGTLKLNPTFKVR